MITKTTEYALRAIVWLARQEGANLTTLQISEAARIPAGYLSKIISRLSRAGFVESTRGPNGGVKLRRAPASIRVLDIVEAIDPLPRIRVCPLDIEAHQTELCPLHRCLDDAVAHVEEAFSKMTISDLLQEPGSMGPLCKLARKV